MKGRNTDVFNTGLHFAPRGGARLGAGGIYGDDNRVIHVERHLPLEGHLCGRIESIQLLHNWPRGVSTTLNMDAQIQSSLRPSTFNLTSKYPSSTCPTVRARPCGKIDRTPSALNGRGGGPAPALHRMLRWPAKIEVDAYSHGSLLHGDANAEQIAAAQTVHRPLLLREQQMNASKREEAHAMSCHQDSRSPGAAIASASTAMSVLNLLCKLCIARPSSNSILGSYAAACRSQGYQGCEGSSRASCVAWETCLSSCLAKTHALLNSLLRDQGRPGGR